MSVSLILFTGLIMGKLFEKLQLPSLVGMLLAGILLGPAVFNLLEADIIHISTDLRKMALVIILMRAGLSLDVSALKKEGRPVILMSFLPASIEILGMMLLAPPLLGLNLLEAAIMGTVVAAVSPAVIVPRMLRLTARGGEKRQKISQMIMASASVDDVFVIVLFTTLIELHQSGQITFSRFWIVPTAILFGLFGGFLTGLVLERLFNRFSKTHTPKVLLMLSVSFLFLRLEDALSGVIGFSGLLAVMALGVFFHWKNKTESKHFSNQLSTLWVGAEVFLFVLVGATLSIDYVFQAGGRALWLIVGVIGCRIIGVWISLLKTTFNQKEKVFMVFCYLPKATVQAAIGGVPLAMGLASGEMILTVAVLSIVVTAPIGAWLMDHTSDRLLED